MEKSKLLEHLRITIEQDPSFFATAKAENLTNIIEVNKLLDKIQQEAKIRAESAIAEVRTVFLRKPEIEAKAQQAFEKLRKSSVYKANYKYEESEKKYKHAEKLLDDAIFNVESGDYEAIIKAKSIAQEARTTALESYRLVDSAIGIAINEEKQTIDSETRANAAEVNRLRLKKIQDENAIVAAKVAAKTAEEVRSRKVRNAIFAAPGAIIGNIILSVFIAAVVLFVVGGIIKIIFGLNDESLFLEVFSWIGIIAGFGIGLNKAMNSIKKELK